MAEVTINIGANTGPASAQVENLNNQVEGLGTAAAKTTEKLSAQEAAIKKNEVSIKLLGGAVNVLGGAVETTVGILGTIGIKEESLKGFQEGAASAIAFADGTKRVVEGVKEVQEGLALARELSTKYGIATKVLTAIQTVYNAVLNANPIFLIVTVLAAVTAGVYALSKALNDDTEAIQANNEALAKQKALLADNAQFQLDYAKAAGKSAEEVRNAEIKRTNALLESARAEFKAAKTAEDRAKAAKKIGDAKKQQLLEEASFETSQRQKAEQAENEAAQKAKERADKRAADAKAAAEKRAKLVEDAQKIQNEAELNLLGEQERELKVREQAFQAEQKALKEAGFTDLTAITESYNKDVAEINKKYADEAAKLAEDNAKKEADKIKELGDLQASIRDASAVTEEEQRALNIQKTTEYYDQLIAEAKKNGIDTVALEQAKQAKINQITQEGVDTRTKLEKFYASEQAEAISASLSAVSGLAGALADAIGEDNKDAFEKGKKFKIAQVITSAIQSSFEAFGAAQKLNGVVPGLGTAIGIANVAAIAIASKKAISDIQSSTFEGGNASAAASIGSGGGGGTVPAPGLSPSFLPGGFLSPNAGTPNTQRPEPIKAYVVTGDVVNGIEAEGQINRRRSL